MDLQEGGQRKREATSASTISQKTTANKLKKEGPNFYKIIVAPSTQSQKLRIPQDYVKTYKRQLKKGYVKLRVPDNSVWLVELFKENGEVVWLTEGWEVFFKSYGLQYGYFLLFSYDKGDSEFHVTIFGLTSCEIEYDLVFSNYLKAQQPALMIAPQLKEMDLDAHVDAIAAPENGVVVQEETSVNKSQNAQFKAVMNRRNVSNDYDLNFPYNHIREHLKPIKFHELILTTLDGKRYNLKLTVYMKHCFSRLNNGGWRKFVEDNKLKEGDACVFELVNPDSNTYKVTIFPADN